MGAGLSAKQSKSEAVTAFVNSVSSCFAVRALSAPLNAENEKCGNTSDASHASAACEGGSVVTKAAAAANDSMKISSTCTTRTAVCGMSAGRARCGPPAACAAWWKQHRNDDAAGVGIVGVLSASTVLSMPAAHRA
jgi:hypothetical protein